MTTIQAVIAVALAALTSFGVQTPQRAFKATARLGIPFTLGYQETVYGSKEKVDTGTLRTLTVSSAKVAAVYPSTDENVSAGPGDRLLIVRGSLQNPSKVVLTVSGSSFLGIRFWDGKGKGEFRFVGIYDPETRRRVHSNLRKGESVEFDCVVRIPAKYDSYRVGFYHQNRARIAWYDLRPKLGRIESTFSPDGFTLDSHARVSKGQSFDFDMFRMTVLGVSEPAVIGGVANGDQPGYVVSVSVTNTMLLPARWGWQYTSPELVMKDSSTVAAVRDLIDKETGKTWSGDLPAGATMTAQFVFRPARSQVPVAFRLTLSSNQRTIEVPL